MQSNCVTAFLLCAFCAAGLIAGEDSPASIHSKGATIRAEIVELRSDDGIVRCTLFNKADGFPVKYQNAIAGTNSKIASRKAVCEFADVPAGTYAIAVFHDEDANGKMRTNFIGIPKEGTGASSNPKPRFGPPKFKDAQFEHGTSESVLSIKVLYF